MIQFSTKRKKSILTFDVLSHQPGISIRYKDSTAVCMSSG